MSNPISMLSTIESSGRRIPKVIKGSDDQIHVLDPHSRPCPGCDQVTNPGDEITKVFRVWWHADCAVRYLQRRGEAEAWRVLGSQLAAHPRAFNVGTTRAIVHALLDLAGDE